MDSIAHGSAPLVSAHYAQAWCALDSGVVWSSGQRYRSGRPGVRSLSKRQGIVMSATGLGHKCIAPPPIVFLARMWLSLNEQGLPSAWAEVGDAFPKASRLTLLNRRACVLIALTTTTYDLGECLRAPAECRRELVPSTGQLRRIVCPCVLADHKEPTAAKPI